MDAQQNVAVAQEKFIINLDANVAKIVSPVDRKELAAAYLQMFSGFAWRNWTNKYSLGRAWQTALAQCAAFTDTKNDKNPAAKYLKNVYEAHKKYWSRVIMTHSGRDNTINPNDQDIQKLRAHGERMIREAMDKINLILARYNERGEKLVGQQKQAQAQHHAVQPQPQVGAMAQQNTPQQADMMAQANAMPMPSMAQITEQERPAVAQATKSVAQPTAQSGAFAMMRDTVKRPNAAIVDKPVEVPMAKPAEQQMEKQQPTVAKPAQMPIDVQKQTPQTVVQHAPKSVAQHVKPSGALPAIQDKAKQQNVVKTETKAEEFAKAEKRVEISAEQRAQLQIEFQKRIQMWQLGQFKQNAA